MRRRLTAPLVFVLFFATLSSGCDFFGFSPEEKINSAIPLSESVIHAKSVTLEQASSKQKKEIETEFASRLKLRALSCAKGYTPHWYASKNEIRQKLSDHRCFSETDMEIIRWLEMRRVGFILAKEPLKPIPSTPPSYIAGEEFIQYARFSANAGVALFSMEKSLRVVDLATGKPILSDVKTSSQPGFLSPNGRLFTWGSDSGVKIRDAETGTVITDLPFTRAHEFHWLDNRFAIYNRIDTGKAQIVDFTTGRESTLAGIQGPAVKAVPVPNTRNQFVVCTYRNLMKIEVAGDAQEPEAKILKTTPNDRRSCSINTSGVTADGSRFFEANTDLVITSLEPLEQERISFEPFILQTAVATPDPNKILVTGFVKATPGQSSRDLLYSIKERTVAPIDRSKLHSQRFVDIPALKKMAVINNSILELLGNLPLQESITLSKFSDDLIQEANLRKLDEFERQQTTLQPVLGPVAQLASDAQIEAVGVYQGTSLPGASTGNSRRTGLTEVYVRRAAKPVLLVLSSYEPVRWTVTLEPGARLAGVLLSGYYQSQVIGAGSARTVDMGKAHAYKTNSPEYKALDDEVYKLTGKHIGLFQGRYEGKNFSVGG